ncbi:MAG: hypothetical protein HC890_10380 [Chloroflexaceae bacterium]|nr:hypothetical protein [Chloroflexaceae bacterium]
MVIHREIPNFKYGEVFGSDRACEGMAVCDRAGVEGEDWRCSYQSGYAYGFM